MPDRIKEIYRTLYSLYGPQGWWPLLDCRGVNPTKTGSLRGYHPLDYTLPRTRAQIFEICVGAILTQNTAWPNVERALWNLKAAGALEPKALLRLEEPTLKEAIRPAGYFNQKARKVRIFTEFFLSRRLPPSREELLALWGIGKETADSMLLYAFKVPTFVVDTYTRRVLASLGMIRGGEEYDEVKRIFEDRLEPDLAGFQEYHALLVEHAKRCHAKKSEVPDCSLCKKYRVRGP